MKMTRNLQKKPRCYRWHMWICAMPTDFNGTAQPSLIIFKFKENGYIEKKFLINSMMFSASKSLWDPHKTIHFPALGFLKYKMTVCSFCNVGLLKLYQVFKINDLIRPLIPERENWNIFLYSSHWAQQKILSIIYKMNSKDSERWRENDR